MYDLQAELRSRSSIRARHMELDDVDPSPRGKSMELWEMIKVELCHRVANKLYVHRFQASRNIMSFTRFALVHHRRCLACEVLHFLAP